MRDFNKLKKIYWLQLFAVLMLGTYLVFFGHWQVETNLLSILPKAAQQQDFKAAEKALFSDKSQQLVVLISGENALTASQTLAKKINEIAAVDSMKIPEPSLSAISDFYLPYRHNLLTPSYLENINDSQVLLQLASEQLVQIANPFVSATIATAPRLNLADYMQVALSELGEFEFEQGFAFVNAQGQDYFISRFQVSLDGLDLNASAEIATQLQQLFSELKAAQNVDIVYSGILFHTAESTAQAQAEISSFGVFSVLAVLLLIWTVFRSLLPLVAAILVLTIASAYGFIAMLLFFKSLHLLTLVFAVTLIGVVIDYCFHAFVYAGNAYAENVYAESADANTQQDNETRRNPLLKPLVLGFITTAIGYFLLVFSPLSLLSQVAVFMIFGLFGALITVLMLLPQLKGFSSIRRSARAIVLSEFAVSGFRYLLNYKTVIVSALVLTLVLLIIIAPIKFNDDVRLLNSSPKWLLAQEVKVAKLLNYQNSQRVIIKADTPQKMLATQERVIAQLSATQANISVKGMDKLLPSIKRQQQNYSLLARADAQGHFQQVMALSGLADPITDFQPLTLAAFLQGPLAPIAHSYIASYPTNDEETTEYALWLELSQEPLSVANLRWISEQENVALFDTAGTVSGALSEYRHGVLWLLVSAFIAVTVILLVKYGIKAGALSSIATIGSALLALTFSQLLSNHLNIFNLLAVLLIIALAIDYVIFYHEHGLQAKTFLAISLSALSSAAVFGILVFSVTPAVSSFGLTVMMGIVSIFILAPLSAKQSSKQSV
ncbi:MAG: MMPL family transporter [Cognaticolwellia sp.]